MLNVSSRRALPWVHAPFQILMALSIGLALPAVHAVEPAPEQAPPTPFERYQAWRDAPLDDWRQANERVGEIGGWRTYLREAQQGDEAMDHDGHAHHGRGQ
jgi:hypothetical protein